MINADAPYTLILRKDTSASGVFQYEYSCIPDDGGPQYRPGKSEVFLTIEGSYGTQWIATHTMSWTKKGTVCTWTVNPKAPAELVDLIKEYVEE